MRCIVEFDETAHPPRLSLFIHGAPHRRVPVVVLQSYRQALAEACAVARIRTPIDRPIDLSVCFIDPTSPDLDNLLTGLYQAMDGKTLRGPGIVADDGLIHHVRMSKFFPGAPRRVAV